MKNDQDRKEWLVVINPNAGNGKGKKDWDRIYSLFKKNDITVIPYFSDCKGHSIEIARTGIKDGHRNIVAVGGDGTLNEVINGVFTQEYCPATAITVGLVPVGTGNDWGRMFGIPLVYEGAVDVIRDCKVMRHDIGVITYYTGDEQHTRYFINIAGVGFESIVVRRTNKQKERGRSNPAIYFYTLLSSLISYRNVETDIYIDGRKSTTKIFSINVGNGRYCGGGMRQTPEALPDDGLLDITVIRGIGRIEIIKSLKLLYDGTILSHPKVDGYRTTNIRIESESPVYAEADGETLGHTPAEFSIIPGAINIVYGTKIIP